MFSVDEVFAGLQAVSVWQERLYKDFHVHPELSFQEIKTAALTATKLKEVGYEVIEGIGSHRRRRRPPKRRRPERAGTGLTWTRSPSRKTPVCLNASTLTAADDAGVIVRVAHACDLL